MSHERPTIPYIQDIDLLSTQPHVQDMRVEDTLLPMKDDVQDHDENGVIHRDLKSDNIRDMSFS